MEGKEILQYRRRAERHVPSIRRPVIRPPPAAPQCSSPYCGGTRAGLAIHPPSAATQPSAVRRRQPFYSLICIGSAVARGRAGRGDTSRAARDTPLVPPLAGSDTGRSRAALVASRDREKMRPSLVFQQQSRPDWPRRKAGHPASVMRLYQRRHLVLMPPEKPCIGTLSGGWVQKKTLNILPA